MDFDYQNALKQYPGNLAEALEQVPYWLSWDAHSRRQFLRHLTHDTSVDQALVFEIVKAALSDPDWEVRATAIMTAARRRLSELGALVAEAELPSTRREGLSKFDLSVLRALRKAALLYLKGEAVPEDTRIPPFNHDTMGVHLLRCVAGQPTRWHDQVLLWSIALSQPILPTPAAENLPDGLVADNGEYTLKRTQLEMLWVPPQPHWVGACDENLTFGKQQALPNPIRQDRVANGFFISKWPLLSAFLERQKLSHLTDRNADPENGYALGTWAQTQSICAALSEIEQTTIQPPTLLMLEMSARGPDARRYPWGNGIEAQQRRSASPWGLLDSFGTLAQWTTKLTPKRDHVVFGGRQQRHCAWHLPAADASYHGLRLVIPMA